MIGARNRITRLSIIAASVFAFLAPSPAWAQSRTPAEELETLKRMVQEVLTQNEDLKRRVRELEAAISKPERPAKDATNEAAKEASNGLTNGGPKEASTATTTSFPEPGAQAPAVKPDLTQTAATRQPVVETALGDLTTGKSPWGKIQIGGAVELQAQSVRNFSGVRTATYSLSTAEFDFEANVVEWAKAELSLETDTNTNNINLNEALITISKSSFPVYFKGGRGTVPFGISSGTKVSNKLEDSLTLTGPLTTDVFEAKEDYALVGVKAAGFHAGGYIYNGSTNQVGGGGKRLEHFGFTAGYGFKGDSVSVMVASQYIDSVFDTDGLSSAFPQLQNPVHRYYTPGIAATAKLGLWGFSLIAEYDTATRNTRTDQTSDKTGTVTYDILPRAWQLELGYTTEIFFGTKTYVAVNYSRTYDLLGQFPKKRFLATAGSWLVENIRLAFEYGYDQDYSKVWQGTGRDSNYYTLRMTYEW